MGCNVIEDLRTLAEYDFQYPVSDRMGCNSPQTTQTVLNSDSKTAKNTLKELVMSCNSSPSSIQNKSLTKLCFANAFLFPKRPDLRNVVSPV